MLGKKPEEITLYDIVVVMEGPYFLDKCVLG
ncbi:MAG: Rrf2 family transcriptional regulator, partial [Spirochaetes bacterium]